MELSLEVIRKNVEDTLSRIEAARVRAGLGHEVRIVAATEYVTPEGMGW